MYTYERRFNTWYCYMYTDFHNHVLISRYIMKGQTDWKDDLKAIVIADMISDAEIVDQATTDIIGVGCSVPTDIRDITKKLMIVDGNAL